MAGICTNPRCDGTTYLCGKCRKLYPFSAAAIDAKRGQNRGGRSASPVVDGYGSTKDQGGRGAKRQSGKNHGTNRRGGGYR